MFLGILGMVPLGTASKWWFTVIGGGLLTLASGTVEMLARSEPDATVMAAAPVLPAPPEPDSSPIDVGLVGIVGGLITIVGGVAGAVLDRVNKMRAESFAHMLKMRDIEFNTYKSYVRSLYKWSLEAYAWMERSVREAHDGRPLPPLPSRPPEPPEIKPSDSREDTS